jgi:hypothetical protein
MATTEELRLKILDRPQVVLDERVGTGDGSNTVFQLRHVPVMADSQTVRVGGTAKTEGVDYTLDDSSGKLVFLQAPDEGDEITASYDFAAFTDSELQAFLDSAGGNVALAAGEALTTLIADRSRLVTWSKGDARMDFDRLRRDLADVARRFISQGASEVGGARSDDVEWEEVV